MICLLIISLFGTGCGNQLSIIFSSKSNTSAIREVALNQNDDVSGKNQNDDILGTISSLEEEAEAMNSSIVKIHYASEDGIREKYVILDNDLDLTPLTGEEENITISENVACYDNDIVSFSWDKDSYEYKCQNGIPSIRFVQNDISYMFSVVSCNKISDLQEPMDSYNALWNYGCDNIPLCYTYFRDGGTYIAGMEGMSPWGYDSTKLRSLHYGIHEEFFMEEDIPISYYVSLYAMANENSVVLIGIQAKGSKEDIYRLYKLNFEDGYTDNKMLEQKYQAVLETLTLK